MPKSTHQVRRTFNGRLDEKANRNRYLSAIIGHPDGTVYVEDRLGYVWARLGGANGQIIQVYARGVLGAYNLPIVVYHPPHRPRDYAIIDLDLDAFASSGTGEDNDGGYDGTAYAQAHAAQHYYNGGDPVLVHLRAWTPLRVYPSSGLVIGVMPGLIARAGTDLEVVHQALDLGPFAPESGALYVLITIDADGLLAATAGAAVGGLLDLTIADIPDTPAGHFRLAAIRLFSGQTSVRETRTLTDIVDLRWPQERLAGDALDQFGAQAANTVLAGPTSGAAALPTFRAGVTDDIASGVFPIARGGTAADTATDALNNLLPAQSGQAGNVLTTDGTNASWGPGGGGGGGGGGTITITTLPVGTIVPFGAAAIPSGWLECNGAAISRTTYADLFTAIGTTYGAGNGSTTFNLPDLRGRVSIGQGTGTGLTPRTLGATGGEETHVLSAAEMPAHTHTVRARNTTSGAPINDAVGGSTEVGTDWYKTTSSAGSDAAHNTLPPFVVTAYIIKYTNTATSDLIFNDGALPANVTGTPATGSAVYAARRDHVHAHTLTDAHILVGNVLNVAADVALSGDATLANTGALTLATVNSNVGSYGSATQVATFTVNAKGLITAAGNTPITGVVPAAHDIITAHTYTGGAALDVFGLSAANTIAKLTPSSAPGAVSSILKSDANGYLQLVRLGAGVAPNESIEVAGNIRLPATTSTTGIIKSGTSTFIHVYGTNNTFLGVGAGNLTLTGTANTVVGSLAGRSLTNGGSNVFIGYDCGGANQGGGTNVAIGYSALAANTAGGSNFALGFQTLFNSTGDANVAIGRQACYTQVNVSNNVGIGYQALFNAAAGNNVAIGRQAGYTNSSGSGNVFLGYLAGYRETASNTLIIDNTTHGSEAADRVGALLYGTFNADASLQTLTANALLTVRMNTAATNAAVEALRIEARTSGTAAAGFGPMLTIYGKSATADTYRQMAAWKYPWSTATDASRKARIIGTIFDTVERQWLQVDTDGSGAQTKIGDGTNYAQFANDGTLTLVGTATVFDDLQTPLIGAKLDSPSSHIELNLAEGAVTFKTSCDLTDYVVVVPQMTHRWKAGSDISPHLHWWQTSSTVPNWLIQYRWQKNGGVKTTAWTSAKYTAMVSTYTSGTLNQIAEFPDITAPAGYGMSDIVQFRILRDVANTSTLFAGTDGLAASVEATSFDFHVEMDRLGSSSEYVV